MEVVNIDQISGGTLWTTVAVTNKAIAPFNSSTQLYGLGRFCSYQSWKALEKESEKSFYTEQ